MKIFCVQYIKEFLHGDKWKKKHPSSQLFIFTNTKQEASERAKTILDSKYEVSKTGFCYDAIRYVPTKEPYEFDYIDFQCREDWTDAYCGKVSDIKTD
jgi:hypothetical protein